MIDRATIRDPNTGETVAVLSTVMRDRFYIRLEPFLGGTPSCEIVLSPVAAVSLAALLVAAAERLPKK